MFDHFLTPSSNNIDSHFLTTILVSNFRMLKHVFCQLP